MESNNLLLNIEAGMEFLICTFDDSTQPNLTLKGLKASVP